jgi:hypothetical protein
MIGLLLRILGIAPARPRPAAGARRTRSAPGRWGAAAPMWRPLSREGPERPFPVRAQWPGGR